MSGAREAQCKLRAVARLLVDGGRLLEQSLRLPDQRVGWSAKAPLGEPAKGQFGSPGCIGSGAVPIAALADGELSKSNISSRSLAFASRAVRLGSEKRFSRSARIEV